MFNPLLAYSWRGGGEGLLALEMGRDMPPACSKPDPVPIRLGVKRHPVSIWKLTPNLIDRLMV